LSAAGVLDVAELSGLLEHRREAGGCGEAIGDEEALDRACLGDELGRQRDRRPRQAADEGRVRLTRERRSNSASSSASRFLVGSASTASSCTSRAATHSPGRRAAVAWADPSACQRASRRGAHEVAGPSDVLDEPPRPRCLVSAGVT
jgi:hypothetical protein